jgi:ABC-2 type transport system permease protein
MGEYFTEIIKITIEEYRHVFADIGVVVIFVAASILYPLIYNGIYKNEVLRDVPVAVVDLSNTPHSRELARGVNATPELSTAYFCNSMDEAKMLFQQQKVHGIIFIPGDFSADINSRRQATVSLYSDMSSFMYYRTLMAAVNGVVQGQGEKIHYERLHQDGVEGEQAQIAASPMQSKTYSLYNSYSGFSSFLLPAMMILILHQTLFLGIGMEAGARKEENKYHLLIPVSSKRSIFKIVTGKSIVYFSLYFLLAFYALGFIPRFFNLPHIGDFLDIVILIIPFLLATIFFSMTVSVFMARRETVIVVFIFCSLILLFLSGFSWPRSNISKFWLILSWIFPSTHGIQAYIKLNTMGAERVLIRKELIALWVQTGVYFITTLVVYRIQIYNNLKFIKRKRNKAVGKEMQVEYLEMN